MRWPFHFGRPAVAEKASAAERPAQPNRREWASLPPIQRAGGDAQLTAPTAQFIDSLAGTHDPDLSLEPLGHHVSLDAPHGQVTGVTRSFETYSPSTELVGRPRRVAPSAIVQRESDASIAAEPEPSMERVDATEESAPLIPLRELAAVDAVVPSERPLVRLADADRAAVMPIASVQRARDVAPEPAQESAVAEAAITTSATAPLAQRLTLGQSRRLGLGAPLTPSAVAALQRSSPPSPAMDLPPRERQTPAVESKPEFEQRSEPEHFSTVDAVVQRGILAPAADRGGGLSPLPVVRKRAESSGGSSESQGLTQPLTPEVQTAMTKSAQAQLMPGVAVAAAPSVQRVMATSLPPLYSRPAPAAVTAPLVASGQPILASRSTVQPARDGTPQVGVQLMPDSRAALEKLPTPTEQVQAALPWIPATPGGFAATLQPRSHLFTPPSPAPSLSVPPFAQRIIAPAEPASPTPMTLAPPMLVGPMLATTGAHVPVQLQVDGGESPSPPAAVAPSTSAAAPSAGALPAHDSEKDLDELARRLHDRISARIRYDLLVDRERAGMVTDLR